MWIGTLDGLNRFDGYEFVVYKHDPTDSTSISDNYVNYGAIFEDEAGGLWVGTRGGLNRRDPTTGQFRRYQHDPEDPHSLSHDNVLAFSEFPTGVLWIGTEEGLNRYDATTDRFTRYFHDAEDVNTLSASGITALRADSTGTLWIGTRHGLNALDLLSAEADGQASFRQYRHDPEDPHGLPFEDIFSLHIDRAGTTLWIGTWGGGLIRFSPESGTFTQYLHDPAEPASLPDNEILTLYEDRGNHLLIGTWGGGLCRFDPLTEGFACYAQDTERPHHLSQNQVGAIFEDRSGVLWIGTWDKLNKVLPNRGFTVYGYQPGMPWSPNHPNVSQVYEGRDGVLWIGTLGGGLSRWDRTENVMTHFMHDPLNPYSLSHNVVNSVLEDRTGYLWVGTKGGGLSRYDWESGRFTSYRHDAKNPHSLSSDLIYSIYESADGILWVGTVDSGLNQYDRANDRFIRHQHDPQNPNSLSYDSVWAIYEDRSGWLWVGTIGGGLNRYDRKTGTYIHYRHEPDNPYSLSNDRVIAIHEDAQGTLWVGTMGGGLNKLDRETGHFTQYTTQDGLPGSNAVCMLTDEAGYLWVGTSEGISKFDPIIERFTNYGVEDGLPDSGFYFNACYESARGEFLFGSYAGVVAFHPGGIRENPYPPPVALTGFDLFNEPVHLDSSLTHLKRITLSHDQNFVAFHFAALDFTLPTKNSYKYMLESVDKAWVEAADRRYASYPNLMPGRYRFRVKGSNNDGVWNEEGASISLIITPPWWQMWWAYGLYGIGFILMVAAFIRWRVNTIDKKHLAAHAEQLAQLDKAKSRFFANISHEFRTPLTLIMGPLNSILAGNYGIVGESLREQLGMMLRNSQRLQRLINQILDLTKIEADSVEIKARPQELATFVHKCVQPFTPLAERQHITLVAHPAKEEIIVYFDPESLEKVIMNLLSNALKFTPHNGLVEVSVRKKASTAEIVVRDTGLGIPENKLPHIFDRFYQVDNTPTRLYEGTGIGLALAKDLVRLHGGEISVESTVGVGSTFTVSLPLGRQHLSPRQIVDEEPKQQDALWEESVTPYAVPDSDSIPELETADPAERRHALADEEDITTVLVVDDNADVRAYVRSILESTYRVLEAENGKRGLQCVQESLPDLVLADVMMPEMDGFALSRAMKESPMTDCIPVVILTARAAKEDELEGLGTGADDYVIKPFEAEVLLARVENLISLRQQLRERFSQGIETSGDGVTMQSTQRIESRFLANVRRIIETHMTDVDFTVDDLTREAGVSYSRLYTKLREELEVSPSHLIRTIRVEQAAVLLEEGVGNISEIAYAVGFNSLSYFTKCFRKRFEMTPSHYAHTARSDG